MYLKLQLLPATSASYPVTPTSKTFAAVQAAAALFYLPIFLWSPYVIGQIIIFSSCDFFLLLLLSFFFPRLISAAVDWMSTILPHMVWP